jgi:DNA-binding transcriptional MerR regulator
MLKIGDFSILSGISIHMLRHYDEIGLLLPDYTDQFTGYRYYREEKLLVGNRIQALKSMGFGLKDICEIVNDNLTDEEFISLLKTKAVEIQREVETLKNRLGHIMNTLNESTARNEFTGQIAVKEIPERKMVCLRSKIKQFSDEGLLWKSFFEECGRHRITFSKTEYNVSVLYAFDMETECYDIEVQKSVDGCLRNTGLLEFRTEKAVKAASLVFRGGYMKLADVNNYVAEWIDKNGYELNGNIFSIYHVSPGNASDEDEFITEVCFPIKNKKNPLTLALCEGL